MQLVPNSSGTSLREFNQCHAPGGSPAGGQFCSDRDAFVGVSRPSPAAVLAAPYGKELGATVLAARRRLTKLMEADGNEHMVVVQPGEHPFYFTSGSDRFVELPTREFQQDLLQNTPLFTAHTHPTGSAPSLQDIRMQTRFKTSHQLIFGDNGEWYELEITDLAKATKVIGEGRREANWYTAPTKGKFASQFDRLKKLVTNEAVRLTDQWAAKQYGWTIAKQGGLDGFMIPIGDDPELQHVRSLGQTHMFMTRKEAGKLHPAIRQVHIKNFSELSPRIWLTLAEKHKDWLKFRMHRTTGPYATTTTG
jgi:hypothetical protein